MSGGDWKEMFNAGCVGDLELVKHHVKAGVDVNYAHPEFLSTPLVAAIIAKQEEVALYLIEHGALPDLPSEFDGVTPVQAAGTQGSVQSKTSFVAWVFSARPCRANVQAGSAGLLRKAPPNPSVKRSAIGRPPSPRSAVVYPALHGLGGLPLSPAYLER